MAAGKFFTYTTAVKYMLQGNIDLDTQDIVAVPLHQGYTPSTASHSALAQISARQSTGSGSLVSRKTLTGVAVTGSGAQTVKYTASSFQISAGGDTFKCKYIALFAKSASAGGNDNLLIGFFDTDTASVTGVEAIQVNVNIPTGGLFKVNVNA